MSVITDEVDQLYLTILDRAPDTQGFDFWTQQLSAGVPLQQVRDGFAYSVEATDDLTALSDGANAGLTGAEIVGYEDQLSAGSTLAQVTTQLDDDHIGVLYQSILGRTPEPAGLAFWENALAQGASIQFVQNGVAYSQEATNRIEALASSQSLPLSGADIDRYETELAGGWSFGQMTADLDAKNGPAVSSYPVFPVSFTSGAVVGQTVPAGDTVQPFAALDISSMADPAYSRASVSPGSYVAGIAVFSNLSGGSVDQYGQYQVSGSAAAVQSALNGLTLSLDPAGDAVSLTTIVYGGSIFPDDIYTNVSAAPGGSLAGRNFIDSSGGADLLAGSPAPDVFVIAKGTASFVTIIGFDPGHDTLQIDPSLASSFAQVQAEMSAEGPGAYLHLGVGNAICLVGVDPTSLSAADFRFA